MKIRVFSGAIFVALITSLFLLREFVDFRLFNLLLWFFSFVGSCEIIRAVMKYSNKSANIVALIFCGIFVPLFVVVEHFFSGYGYIACLILITIQLILQLVLVGRQGKFVFNVLPAVYPNLLILCMLVINYMPGLKGFIAMLLVFIIAPFADTFAYFTGSLIGGKKLCPKLSPKKTWSGAIGGTIGGSLGSVIIYFIFGHALEIRMGYIVFLIMGFIASIITIFGDLFASLIKRKVGIKDYGKIMPGHGGVMDRIDSTSFASAFIMLVFLVM